MSDEPLTCWRALPGSAYALDLFNFLLPMHEEVGFAPFDRDTALVAIDQIIRNGRVFMAQRGEHIVGSIGLSQMKVWYGDATFWGSAWVYVTPEERDGPVLRVLLDEVADMVEEEGAPAFLHFFRPCAKGRVQVLVDESVVMPAGHVLAIKPRGAE